MTMRCRLASEDGVTLTELVVVLSILGFILGTAFLLLNAGTAIADRIEARDRAGAEGRTAIQMMTRELRQAAELAEGQGVFANAQPRRCSFYVDLNHDRVPERITYYVQGKQLLRTVSVATGSVPPYTFGAESSPRLMLTSLKGGWNGNVFTYYDNQDPADTVSSGHSEDISAVALHVVSEGSAGRATEFVDLSTWVRLRTVHNAIR